MLCTCWSALLDVVVVVVVIVVLVVVVVAVVVVVFASVCRAVRVFPAEKCLMVLPMSMSVHEMQCGSLVHFCMANLGYEKSGHRNVSKSKKRGF